MICDTGKCTPEQICDYCKSLRVVDLICKCGKKHRSQVGMAVQDNKIDCNSTCKE